MRRPARGWTRTRQVEVGGGIHAQRSRGAFATSWWAKQWLEMLNSSISESRLSRGRTYARQGRVVALDVRKGKVEARVQGSRSRPYVVTIGLTPFSADSWQRVARALAEQPGIVAALLAGEMPEEIETVCHDLDLSLLPRRASEIKTSCSCPDWENPCKHVAAVYLLLTEAIDRDPFLVFQLRGLTRDELVAQVLAEDERDTDVAQATAGTSSRRTMGTAAETAAEEATVEPAELPTDPGVFWRGKAVQAAPIEPTERSGLGEARGAQPEPDRWLRQLGSLPFWRGEQPLPEALAPLYARAAALAQDLAQELACEAAVGSVLDREAAPAAHSAAPSDARGDASTVRSVTGRR